MIVLEIEAALYQEELLREAARERLVRAARDTHAETSEAEAR